MSVITVWGPYGTAKSTFLFGCPGPIFDFDLESGAHRAYIDPDNPPEYETWDVNVDPEVMLEWLTFTRGGAIHGRVAQWEAVTQKFVEVIRENKYKTIGFDTAKVLWDIDNQSILELRQRESPNKQTLDPLEYAAPNLRMTNIIDICNKFKLNLVLICHEREVYGMVDKLGNISKDGRAIPTGNKELEGWNKTLNLSDWVLHTDCDITDQSGRTIKISSIHDNRIPEGEFTFKARIDKSPVGAHITGQILESPSYDKLVRLARLCGKNVDGTPLGSTTT